MLVTITRGQAHQIKGQLYLQAPEVPQHPQRAELPWLGGGDGPGGQLLTTLGLGQPTGAGPVETGP